MMVLRKAFLLALGAAVSLGLARFSYALLLPPMRADLGWSYFTAGFMNTLNAGGYLAGALAMPWLLQRRSARSILLWGSALAACCLGAHGLVRSDEALYALRFATGLASAAVFVSGGVMAARLTTGAAGQASGLVLGIYYGGTGWGIVVSALLVPPTSALSAAGGWAGWQWAWLALAAVALVATVAMAWRLEPEPRASAASAPANPVGAAQQGLPGFSIAAFAFGLAGYFLFGLGYIGYMTFIVSLLREQHLASGLIVAFYVLLGLAVMASPWVWAALLQRQKGGGALALLNASAGRSHRMALAVCAPTSGLCFRPPCLAGVFLSVVASTTALVRHNLAPSRLAGGNHSLHGGVCGWANCGAQLGGLAIGWHRWLALGCWRCRQRYCFWALQSRRCKSHSPVDAIEVIATQDLFTLASGCFCLKRE